MKIIVTILCSLYSCCVLAQDTMLQKLLDKTALFALRDGLSANRGPSETSRLYYSVFVDNGFNRNELAIRRADSFLARADRSWSPQQILRLQETLMDCYVKTFRYRDAADISYLIMNKYDKTARAGILNGQKIWKALSNVPPQTVAIRDNTSVPIVRNEVGLWEIPVQFGNSKENFLFDTGANISTISQSYADKLRLKQIEVDIDVHSGQGKTVRSKLGVADSLSIGNVVVRNVVFLIMPDAQLYFKKIDFTIKGIIGFPVINALKEIHITKAGTLTIPLQPKDRGLHNLALASLTPLLQARVNDDTLVFQFDTGAATTDLYSNYFQRHREEIESTRPAVKKKFVSAGGSRNIKVYESERLRIYIGREMATLYNVNIHTQPVHHAGTGIAEGNMGQDVITQFDEMTINFDSMYISFK